MWAVRLLLLALVDVLLWLVLAAIVGGITALFILAVGAGPAAWAILATSAAALICGATSFVKKDTRR